MSPVGSSPPGARPPPSLHLAAACACLRWASTILSIGHRQRAGRTQPPSTLAPPALVINRLDDFHDRRFFPSCSRSGGVPPPSLVCITRFSDPRAPLSFPAKDVQVLGSPSTNRCAVLYLIWFLLFCVCTSDNLSPHSPLPATLCACRVYLVCVCLLVADRAEARRRRPDRPVRVEGPREHAPQERLPPLRQPPVHPALHHLRGSAHGDHLSPYPFQREQIDAFHAHVRTQGAAAVTRK